MNVTVEDLEPCRKLLRVEVGADVVNAKFDKVTSEFQRGVRLPGFRPGKAPKEMVVKAYSVKIEEEVKRQILNETYTKAIKDLNFRPVTYPDIEEIQFGRDLPLQFAATVDITPTFQLPEYKGIPAAIQIGDVTDADVEKALVILREQRGSYANLDRPAELGDFAVLNYTGSSEGRPLSELSIDSKGLIGQQNFWVHVRKDSFLPGFGEQLIGLKPGDRRDIAIAFPSDFLETKLAGKQVIYDVEILELKQRVLPELTDEFAKSFGARDLFKLREGVRSDLAKELRFKQRQDLRNQLVHSLLQRVNFDLPESIVTLETRNVIYDILRENQTRGVPKEIIDQQKDEIYTIANNNARDRVKVNFLLNRIAETEKISVTDREMSQRIFALAQQHQIKPDKLIKQLQEKNGIAEIRDQILHAKTLDFLEQNAQIQEIPAPPADAPSAT